MSVNMGSSTLRISFGTLCASCYLTGETPTIALKSQKTRFFLNPQTANALFRRILRVVDRLGFEIGFYALHGGVYGRSSPL